MCGRFVQRYTWDEIQDLYDLPDGPARNLHARPHARGARYGGYRAVAGGEAGTELLRPTAEDDLRMWPVSRRVNKTGTGDDDPTLLDEVAG
jgi:putative SOS response-associated peptidase YedK